MKKFIKFPSDEKIVTSAPCRINCGGTWDLAQLALPFECLRPTTVNIALNMRTTVCLTPYEDGRLRIISEGFSAEEYSILDAPLNTWAALVVAIVLHFGIQGLQVHITSGYPPRSGLGGSGTVAVALIGALNEIKVRCGFRRLSRKEIAVIANRIETALGISLTGLQDQVAATFGGVNQWIWEYSNMIKPFLRNVLLTRKYFPLLEKHLLTAYTGIAHDSNMINQIWVQHFLSAKNRNAWNTINTLTNHFAQALKAMDWEKAAEILNAENEIRLSITKEVAPANTLEIMKDAIRLSCGVRFAGAGGGGCVWAIGKEKDIEKLKILWEQRLKEVGGYMLPAGIDDNGLLIA